MLPLLKKKYKLAIINNGNALAHSHWLKKFDYKIFDTFVNSALVGIKKPNPDIYLLTCRKLEVSPTECLFMDDKQENVEAAKQVKMQTICWKPLEYEKHFEMFKSLFIHQQ